MKTLKKKKVYCAICPTWEIKNPSRCSNTLKKGRQTVYFCTKRCKEKYTKLAAKTV